MNIAAINQSTAGLALWQRMAFLALLGGVGVFGFGDHFYHVWTHTLTYHWAPLVDGQSVWVWPVFIGAAALMLAIAYPFTRGSAPPTLMELFSNFAWAHVVYLSSGLLGNAYPLPFTAVMVVLWLWRVARVKADRKKVVLLSVLGALVAAPLEGLFSQLGLFDYAVQQIVRVPWWLFAAYLHAGLLVFSCCRWVRTGEFAVAE